MCRLPLLFTADGMLCFYSLSSLLIWIFRGVSYVTWENQDKVFEKTEVGELKQNGCDGHGYSLWLLTFPSFTGASPAVQWSSEVQKLRVRRAWIYAACWTSSLKSQAFSRRLQKTVQYLMTDLHYLGFLTIADRRGLGKVFFSQNRLRWLLPPLFMYV